MVLPSEYTDERGLIDHSRLIELVKSSVDPEYEWPKKLSVHHLYWPAAWYPHLQDAEEPVNPAAFRQLPIHKALLPRVFENWLHQITIPADMPDSEVMQYRIEAWRVAEDLFKMASGVILNEKRSRRRRASVEAGLVTPKTEDDRIGEDYIVGEFIKDFRGFGYLLERHENLPPEFRLIELDGTVSSVAKRLGKIVMPRSLILKRAAAIAA
jgi:hypothetical protein